MNVKQIAASEVVVGDYILNIGLVDSFRKNEFFIEFTTIVGTSSFSEFAPVFVLDKTPKVG